jgi:vancomycin resistance protein YoaR
MKLEIEEDSIDSFKDQLKNAGSKSRDYETFSDKIDVVDKAKATKIKSLQDREELIIDQMDQIGKESETLQKYVDKVKFQIRIKANDATIKIADGEIEKVLKGLKAEDTKSIKKLDKEIYK